MAADNMVSHTGNPWVTANAPNAIPSGRYPMPTGPVSRAACFSADRGEGAGVDAPPCDCWSGGWRSRCMFIMLGISDFCTLGVLNPGNGYRGKTLPPELVFYQSGAESPEILSNLNIKELVTGCTRTVFAGYLTVR